jgi:protein-S-isoprenylcysteine O-methyltransferase Ste14
LTASEDKHGPGVKIPPPLIAVSVVGLAWLLDRFIPLPLFSASHWLIGGLIIVCAVGIALIAVIAFFRAKTHVEPWKPSSTIIQSGLYRFSRNPIYLTFLIILAGIALVLNSIWVLLGMPLLVWLLRMLVISREERYLEDKFGDEYRQYKNQVRRWI